MESRFEIICFSRRATKSFQRSSPFDAGAVEPLRQPIESKARALRIVHILSGIIGNHLTALDGLQNGVVKIAGKSRALLQPLIKPLS
jgi:hypothetical protein